MAALGDDSWQYNTLGRPRLSSYLLRSNLVGPHSTSVQNKADRNTRRSGQAPGSPPAAVETLARGRTRWSENTGSGQIPGIAIEFGFEIGKEASASSAISARPPEWLLKGDR
eukprot:540220-Rhodomonas_salina.3